MRFLGVDADPAPSAEDLRLVIRGDARANSTLGVVATDARLTKTQVKRIAIMAQDGLG